MASGNPNTFSIGYALTIGTGTELDGRESTEFDSTVNDAEWMGQVLTEPTLCAFPENQVKVLVREDAKRANIIAELNNIKNQIKASDKALVVVFFSGHGKRENKKT